MRIFVAGHRGFIGSAIAGHLASVGHEVVGFDAAQGDDLLDLEALRGGMSGCDAVVHFAALAHDTAGRPEQIMATNVLGTFHVLLAAEAASVAYVVDFSSAQVFGIAEGEQLRLQFPRRRRPPAAGSAALSRNPRNVGFSPTRLGGGSIYSYSTTRSVFIGGP